MRRCAVPEQDVHRLRVALGELVEEGLHAGGVERRELEEEGIPCARLHGRVEPGVAVARSDRLVWLHAPGAEATARMTRVKPEAALVLDEEPHRPVREG